MRQHAALKLRKIASLANGGKSTHSAIFKEQLCAPCNTSARWKFIVRVQSCWNYYDYHEKSDPGPTLPRDFRGNVFTVSMRYSM
jgi:hypothetical protein